MDIPKLLIEQAGHLKESGFNLNVKGDKAAVVKMVAYAMDQNIEVAELLINAVMVHCAASNMQHRELMITFLQNYSTVK